jgi:hypothetical protein
LPLKAINNKVLGYLGNFVDACRHTHTNAARSDIFLVSDGDDISTPALIVSCSGVGVSQTFYGQCPKRSWFWQEWRASIPAFQHM